MANGLRAQDLFRDLTEWFVPDKVTDRGARDKMRVLVGALLLVLLPCLIALVVFLIFPNPGAQVFRLTTLGGMILIFGVVLAFLKMTGSMVFAVNLLAAASFLILSVTNWLSGGLDGPGVLLLILIPVVTMLVAGRRSGWLWLVVVSCGVVVTSTLQAQGLVPDPFEGSSMKPENFHKARTVVFIVTYGLVLGTMQVFDSVASNLRKELDEERRNYENLAIHDGLTGIYNRMSYRQRFEEALARARRADKQVALVMIDLDQFKPINDKFGHAAGDTVLVEIALRLRDTVRSTDTVARLGGDEFAMVLESLGTREETVRLLRKISAITSNVIDIGDEFVSVSASMGVAFYPEHSTNIEELERFSDKAMYRAKQEILAFHIHEESV